MYQPSRAFTYPPHSYTFPHSSREFVQPQLHRICSLPASSSSSSTHSSLSASSIPLAFEPLQPKVVPSVVRAAGRVALAGKLKPDRSKRFLSSKLYFSAIETNGKDTFITLTSSNSTWGTLCNSLTLGFTAPLCRVYFVEIMIQDRVIREGSIEAANFLRREFGFRSHEDSITGEELAYWLEAQQRWEFKTVSFEKMQGNCFAVYCITVPGWSSSIPDSTVLRERVSKRYQILDGFDSVLMLLGRFHNSVWAVFK
ncbi:hypothetical protein BDZ91DRAFT_715014 [Kalaharituber pfeilii]|nr:hypothetical protein BDZ91DRAFT_715014 [Kalaharituber pfeilii]